MNRCVFVGGLGEKHWINDGKILSRNYPQGCRVYSSHGIATALTSQGVGSVGGYSGLYLVGEAVMIEELYDEDLDKTSNGWWVYCNG